MRKIRIVGLVFFAVFAFSVVAATSASAVSKILFNNEEILELLNFQFLGSLLLEDMNATGKPDILCTSIFDGMIEPGGTLAYIEELLKDEGAFLGVLLNELGVENGAGNDMIDCEDMSGVCENPVLVTVLNLPWHIEIELDLEPSLNIYLAHFLSLAEIEELLEVGVGVPTYVVDCVTILGLVEDTCEGLSSARLVNNAEGLLGYFNSLADTEAWGAESEVTNCTIGGLGQGLIESVLLTAGEDTEASGGLFTDPGATGSFSVSE